MANKDGSVSEDLIKFYVQLAEGGTGLIITGFAGVEEGYTVGPKGIIINNDNFIPGYKRLVDAVHQYSAKIAIQLGHSGRYTVHPKYPAVAPSPILNKFSGQVPKELSIKEIETIVKNFVEAARRAYESGFDMVQLHAAHGYLLSSFISPFTNKRTDEFNFENQNGTKILVDIFNGIREQTDKKFPIIIKLQMLDALENGGLTLDHQQIITKKIIKTGFAAIEPSGGLGELYLEGKNTFPSKRINKPEEQNYFVPIIEKIRSLFNGCPIILMGGIRDPITSEKLLEDRFVDFISLSRPLIFEPDLPNRWKNGDLTPARCISCNSCYLNVFSGSLFCSVKKRLEKKKK